LVKELQSSGVDVRAVAREGRYAITIHKSQGSEFPAVVIPLAMQQYMLLQRNLIYTGITRAKRLLVLIGQKKALGIAVRNDRPQRRYFGVARQPEEQRAGRGSIVMPSL
jgi:ATP-dependent exoDNAse (exonuclease V) alpha subunit